jgi:hypothetical protein
MKITLFNDNHRGDLFLSRMFIQPLLNLNAEITFYHNQNKYFFNDIEKKYSNFKEVCGIPKEIDTKGDDILENNLINCWIAKGGGKYVINEGCSFFAYKNMVDVIYKHYNLDIYKNNEELLPIINFDYLDSKSLLKDFMTNLKDRYKKIILISNGNVESGQAINFDFNSTINFLANKNKDCLFLLTQNTNINLQNVLYTSDITKLNPDLLEISYISTFCDIIVGRTSGPYTFCTHKDNIMDNNKTFICFSFNKKEGAWFEDGNAKWIWSDNQSVTNVMSLLDKNI